jgi:hypothetical protein
VIVVFNRAENKIFALAGLGDLFEHYLVFLHIGGAPENQRHVNGFENAFDFFNNFIGAGIGPVGIGAFELQNNHLRPVLFHAFFGPCRRITQYVLKGFFGRL